MVGHGGSSACSYLADPTSPIPSHCASIVVTSTLRVNNIFLNTCKCYTLLVNTCYIMCYGYVGTTILSEASLLAIAQLIVAFGMLQRFIYCVNYQYSPAWQQWQYRNKLYVIMFWTLECIVCSANHVETLCLTNSFVLYTMRLSPNSALNFEAMQIFVKWRWLQKSTHCSRWDAYIPKENYIEFIIHPQMTL